MNKLRAAAMFLRLSYWRMTGEFKTLLAFVAMGSIVVLSAAIVLALISRHPVPWRPLAIFFTASPTLCILLAMYFVAMDASRLARPFKLLGLHALAAGLWMRRQWLRLVTGLPALPTGRILRS